MGHSEVTSEMQIFVLARLLRIEIIQGGDARPSYTNGLWVLMFLALFESDVFLTRLL
jgi:hypothetical protein